MCKLRDLPAAYKKKYSLTWDYRRPSWIPAVTSSKRWSRRRSLSRRWAVAWRHWTGQHPAEKLRESEPETPRSAGTKLPVWRSATDSRRYHFRSGRHFQQRHCRHFVDIFRSRHRSWWCPVASRRTRPLIGRLRCHVTGLSWAAAPPHLPGILFPVVRLCCKSRFRRKNLRRPPRRRWLLILRLPPWTEPSRSLQGASKSKKGRTSLIFVRCVTTEVIPW